MSLQLRDTDAAAACRGKQRFNTPAEANAVLHDMNRRHGREKVSRNVFRCPHCGGWHLTHAKRRAERAPISKRKTGGFRG